MEQYINITSNNIPPAKGKLLLSEPFTGGYYFERSVILLAEHDSESTFGVVINKPIKQKFNDIVANFPKFKAPLFIGGPVEPENLFFIHTLGDKILGSIEIGSGFYWGGDIDIVKLMIEYGSITPNNIRFTLGYSGWSPNQLQNEIKNNSWLVSQHLNSNILKIRVSNLWKSQLTKLGEKYKYWNNFPTQPELN